MKTTNVQFTILGTNID